MRSLRRVTAVVVAGMLLLASCKPRETRIVDRPELSKQLEAVRRLEPSPVRWQEWTAPTSDGHYFVAESGDVNGDGIPDLVAGSFEPGGVAIWTGRPDDTWEYSFVSLPSSEGRDVVLADVDGDGRDEILVVSRGGVEGLLLLRAPRDGPWGRPDVISDRAGYESIAVADIDRDGDVDLAAALGGDRVDGGVEIWLGEGDGRFVNGYALQSGGSFKDVLLASIDDDRYLDLIAAGWGLSQGVRVFYGKGDGGFEPGPVLGAPASYRSVDLGDVDGDGRDDVVATTYRNGIRVFPGVDPSAEPCVLIETGSFWSTLLTDVDGDGRIEINASSSNGLGIMSWTHEKQCEYEPVATGLPQRDVWFGLTFGELYHGGEPALVLAGFSDGIRAFGPAERQDPRAGARARIIEGPDAAEEQWADGNETFTTTQGFPEYRLGVSDLVGVRVFNGESVEEVEAAVQTDGEIFVPARGVGSVPAAGLSPTELKRAILELASKVWREAEVEVVVEEYRAHKVALLGEIRSTARSDSGPGHYAISGKTRVVEFISKHGGPTDHADLNHVQLIRTDGRSSYLNLYKAVLSSDQRENPIINNGDTVFVPSLSLSNRRLIVLGEVDDPGIVEIRDNISLLEAIARVGGFNDRAYLQNIVVIRGGLEAPEVTAVNIRQVLEGGDLSGDLTLRSGDIVYVPHKKIVNFQQVMNSLQPIFQLILDALIIRELANRD
jgi:polysaccharide export outer membrane protein